MIVKINDKVSPDASDDEKNAEVVETKNNLKINMINVSGLNAKVLTLKIGSTRYEDKD